MLYLMQDKGMRQAMTDGAAGVDQAFWTRFRAIQAQLDRGELEAGLREAQALHDAFLDHPSSLELLAVAYTRHLKFEEAIPLLERCVAMNPGKAGPLTNLGFSLFRAGRHEDSLPYFAQALAASPDNVETLVNRGMALTALGRYEDAQADTERVLELKPDHQVALFSLAGLLASRSKHDEAIAVFDQLLARYPDNMEAIAASLFTQNLRMPQEPARIAEKARAMGNALRDRLAVTPTATWAVTPEASRRLRIGLVTADLQDHPVGFFIEGLLSQPLSRTADWVAFQNFSGGTALTERVRPHFAAWHEIKLLRDAAVAELVRNERIDVLIDLSGHTRGQRLGVFLHRPAPLQLTWLGYFGTTGLECFDGIIADPVCVPSGEDAWFTERVVRLPHTRLCITVPPSAPEPSPLPALRNGYLTFGCNQQLSKINDDVLAAWGHIVMRDPHVRLKLRNAGLNSPALASDFFRRLRASGIPPERIDMAGSLPRMQYLHSYDEMDIALDTFSYPGGTTTAEAVWMGVPTITLATPGMLGRQGEGLMAAAGMPEWTVHSPMQYVEKALDWAQPGRWEALAALRADMRARVRHTPLFDQARFAQDWHALVRALWRERCQQPWHSLATEAGQ